MTPTMIRQLADLGLSIAQIAGVMEIFDTESAERRAKVAARMQRYREGKAKRQLNVDTTTTLRSVTVDPRAGVTRAEDNLLTKKISGQIRKEGRKEETRASDFDSFWSLYPNKVGKAAAKRAWEGAAQRVDAETLMSGLRRYVNKTDDRQWCNPATWLNQDRWEDQPAMVVERGRGPKSYATQLKDMVRENADDEGLQSENGHWSDAGGLFPRQSDGPEGHRGPLRLVGKGKGD